MAVTQTPYTAQLACLFWRIHWQSRRRHPPHSLLTCFEGSTGSHADAMHIDPWSNSSACPAKKRKQIIAHLLFSITRKELFQPCKKIATKCHLRQDPSCNGAVATWLAQIFESQPFELDLRSRSRSRHAATHRSLQFIQSGNKSRKENGKNTVRVSSTCSRRMQRMEDPVWPCVESALRSRWTLKNHNVRWHRHRLRWMRAARAETLKLTMFVFRRYTR